MSVTLRRSSDNRRFLISSPASGSSGEGSAFHRKSVGALVQPLVEGSSNKDQEMARCRSTRESYPKMRALQQLTCLIGNDEYSCVVLYLCSNFWTLL